jgi:endonuclease/exonuclease/phosphatase family metal-dependent hydrolase
MPDVTLRVLTLNLWHDMGPWTARRALVRQWIERLAPDVIGFQEVLRGPGRDLAAEVTDGMDYAHEFAPAMRFWNDQSLDFGNAVASRWPIADREAIELPSGDDGERRSALSVTIDAPFGPLSFTCTHLHWRFHHGEVRERQVAAAVDLVLRRRPKEGFPPILVGDFNADPDSAEIRYVTGLQSRNGRSVCLFDAWRVAGERREPSDPGYTWCNRNAYADANHEPDRRIDYVFVGPPRRDGAGRVTRCRVVCDEASGDVWPTDHFGVYAELQTPPAAR